MPLLAKGAQLPRRSAGTRPGSLGDRQLLPGLGMAGLAAPTLRLVSPRPMQRPLPRFCCSSPAVHSCKGGGCRTLPGFNHIQVTFSGSNVNNLSAAAAPTPGGDNVAIVAPDRC